MHARLTLLIAALVAGSLAVVGARQLPSTTAAQTEASRVAVDADDIGGVVTSSSGPEAGVWVIAETTDLPTKFREIVVTDDRGRYLIPDLPSANYKVWVRGYGLIDSPAVQSRPGTTLALRAVVAPDAKSAAQYYPASYWYSLLQVPPKEAFPMAIPGGPQGTGGAPAQLKTQAEWIGIVKNNCEVCHQIGNKATREIPDALGAFDSSVAAWDRRLQMGQTNHNVNRLGGKERGLAMYADWTDRIKAGEVPQAPPRPQGLERNLVVTEWDTASSTSFLHKMASTYRWEPTVNAYGSLYSGNWTMDTLEIVDPVKHTKATLKVPLRDESQRKLMTSREPQTIKVPSIYWGDEVIWTPVLNTSTPQMDSKGRVWVPASGPPGTLPECEAASGNPFAKNYALQLGNRGTGGVTRYDPKTGKFEVIRLCSPGHHKLILPDKDETIVTPWNAAPIGGIGWFKVREWEATGQEFKSQGWCPAVIDYNGDGKTGVFSLPNEPPDSMIDRAIVAPGYGIAYNQRDESIWYASPGVPGSIVRMIIGSNPPATCRTEVYEPPYYNPKAPDKLGFTPRGIDVDQNGIVWTALAGSASLASFDRSKCKVLNGPTATGQHCLEGWTLYPAPGPKFKGVTENISADWFYFNWVDRFDTFGLGANTPVADGTGSDSLRALDPKTGKWIELRVPYPMGFYTRGLDGRIDDPKAGWKGRGLWASNDTRTSWHNEGGKGTTPYVAHFQLRPDPLAK